MRSDELSALAGRFVALVLTFVAPLRSLSRSHSQFSGHRKRLLFSISVRSRGRMGMSYPPPAVALEMSASLPLHQRALSIADIPVIASQAASASLSPVTSAPSMPLATETSSDRISARAHPQRAAVTGAAQASVEYGIGPAGAPRPLLRRACSPFFVPRPRQPRTILRAQLVLRSPC